jgi:glycosyltransferase involved in cell wall biosynthesis
MTNQDIKFTVIIPTRERADTLKWALKTCTTQNYDNLEIIVSDNFSQDDTRAVVESYNDKRIKYINTGKRVSMSSNWEFALACVEIDPQRYVTFVGDDDGLIPNALQDLNELIRKLGDVDAIAWKKAQYAWKSCIVTPNRLLVSFKKKLDRLNTKSILQKIINFNFVDGFAYDELPCLYNSFVKMTKIDEVRRKSDRFFHSMTPDVYSGIALSSVIDYHYLSNLPYSVNGASKHSNGLSYALGNSSDQKQAALKFISEIDIPFHPDLVMCPSIPIIVAESALQARDHLDFNIKVNLHQLIKISIGITKFDETSRCAEVLDACNVIASKNNIANSYVRNIDNQNVANINLLPERMKNILRSNNLFLTTYRFLKHGIVSIDGNLAGLNNIYDATILTANLIAEKEKYKKLRYLYSYIFKSTL